jgi:translation initiation factor IF-3
VIDHENNQLGILPVDKALSMARDAGLDLVEVSPTESPPVCRIMDYGKHLYERKKRQKVAAQGHVVSIKEIRLRPKTDPHDRMIKLRHAREFLDEGHKVQFTMLFRGRERFHKDRANAIFQEIIDEFGEAVKVERPPLIQGRRMTMVVAPVKRKPGGASATSRPTGPPAPPAPVARPAPPAAPAATPTPAADRASTPAPASD